MTTFTLDTHATIQELVAAGLESRQAEVVVAPISRADAQIATKQDLALFQQNFKQDIALLKANIWQVVLSAAVAALVVNRFLDWNGRSGPALHHDQSPRVGMVEAGSPGTARRLDLEPPDFETLSSAEASILIDDAKDRIRNR